MITVTKQPEPNSFDTNVRQKGNQFLIDKGFTINPPNFSLPKRFKLPNYWRHAREDLWNAYNGVCAYTGIKIFKTHGFELDHFLPSRKYPGLAYEWDNYRLTSPKLNKNKLNKIGIVDPCELPNNAISLNLFTGKISPNQTLPLSTIEQINFSISELSLNDPDNCACRLEIIDFFWNTPNISHHFQINYPFIWNELERQQRKV